LSPGRVAVAALALTALAAFIWIEGKTPGPLLPLAFLRRPVFTANLLCAGMMTFGMYGLLFLTPLYFQVVRGASPLVAGLELLPMSVSFVIVSQSVGYLLNRFGPRVIMTAGMVCMGAGAMALGFVGAQTDLFLLRIVLFIVGVGLGFNTAPVNGVAVAALPPERSGTASGLVNTFRMIGATLGVAILGTIFATYAGHDAAMSEHFLPGLRAAMTSGGAAEWLSAALAFAFIRHDSLQARR
jgi:predicted MFS family arabinose efflux permease